MKKIIVLLCMIMLVAGCGKKDDSKLIMVTEAGFAPYEYYSNGEIVGVDVDIAKEVAAGISYNEERAKNVDFTINYSTSKQVVIVKNDSGITNIGDINGKKIAVQLGSIADTYVSSTYKDASVVRQKKYLAAIEDLNTGKVDCVVMDLLPAEQILKTNSGLKILDGALVEDSYGMIVKKGNKELLDNINRVLEKLKNEGKIDEYIIKHTEE